MGIHVSMLVQYIEVHIGETARVMSDHSMVTYEHMYTQAST